MKNVKNGTVIVLKSPAGQYDSAIKTRNGWALAGENANAPYQLDELTETVGEIVSVFK
jgi:hypothetical protein